MTTIAVNNTTMACDQLAQFCETKFKIDSKIYELNTEQSQTLFNCNKAYIGFAGSVGAWGEVVEWLVDMSSKPPKLKLDLIALTDDNRIMLATSMTTWVVVSEPHFAIGSGAKFAIAAMSAGASPSKAIEITMDHDPYTGLGVIEYTI